MDESKEPTVLDYVKALLMPWKGKPPALSTHQPVSVQPEVAGAEKVNLPVEDIEQEQRLKKRLNRLFFLL